MARVTGTMVAKAVTTNITATAARKYSGLRALIPKTMLLVIADDRQREAESDQQPRQQHARGTPGEQPKHS